MIEGVTLEQLRTLRAVAEAGSFSAAARRLGRVQAAISQTVDRLESQLGLRLFDRSGRSARLTAHGQAVVAAAAGVGTELEALDELVTRLKSGGETSLSIVIDVMAPTVSLVNFAKEFAEAHPKVELLLFTDTLSSVTAYVREKRATWGVALEDADLRELLHRKVDDVRLVAVAAAGHPLAARRGALTGPDLAGAIQIVLGEHGAPRARPGARGRDEHGVFSPRTWRVVDLATKRALILHGLGWGHLPEHLVRDDLRARVLVELALEAWGGPAPSRSLVLVWRPGARFGPVARWAEERLTQLCRSEISPEVGHHAT